MTAECQAFIEAEKQADRNVAKACELLEVSRSAFYDRLNHTPSPREVSDGELVEKIRQIHAASGGTYGAPRVHDELRDLGWHVGKCVVRPKADSDSGGIRTLIPGESGQAFRGNPDT